MHENEEHELEKLFRGVTTLSLFGTIDMTLLKAKMHVKKSRTLCTQISESQSPTEIKDNLDLYAGN